MDELQIVDFQESYCDESAEERVNLIGRNSAGKEIQVEVERIPHAVDIAIGEEVTLNQCEEWTTQLNEFLRQNPDRCINWDCECNAGNAPFGQVSRELCRKKRKGLTHIVRGFSIVRNRGFHEYEEFDRPFLRIVLSHAFFARKVQEWVLSNSFGSVKEEHFGVYEVYPSAVDSFIYQKNIASFDTWSFPTARIQSNGRYLVHFDELVQVNDAAPAPQEWLALDIETIAKKYINSESKRADYPVGIICTTLKSGERRAFMLGPPVPGATCFDDESDMLRAFYAYVRHVNPDGFITYNGNSFDIPYLTTRSERLGVHECVNIARMPEYKLRIKHTENKTAANGTLKTTLIDCPGRISLDLYMIGRKTLKLRKYKLASVAAYYGLEGKEDLSYTDIYPYFYGTVEQRQQLLSYCARDTDLVIEIERKMGAIVQLSAQCKVLRLRARDALDRGLGYRLNMMIAAERKEMGYVVLLDERMPKVVEDGGPVLDGLGGGDGLGGDEGGLGGDDDELEEAMAELGLDEPPTKDRDKQVQRNKLALSLKYIKGYLDLFYAKLRGEKYKGAFVFPPKVKVYRKKVVGTFDFSSLYPSIIRAFNICRTTQVRSPQALPAHMLNVSPCEPQPFAYVKAEVREGVLPRVERKLVDARNKVRKEQKNHAEGSERWNMLEAEQKQIKIAANSVYGLLGSIVSPIGDISAAFSVTSWGAKLITEVQSKLQEHFIDAEVVYGDTDSIMILLNGCESVEEGLSRFKKIDTWINKESGILKDPLKMEFEDITFGYVLYGKKHYIKRKYDIKDITKPPELKVAGMQSRAQNPYVTETVDYILEEFLLKEKPEEEMIEYIQERLRRLWAGEVDVAELVHSKNLTKALQEYDNENEQTTAARQRIYDGLPTEPGDRLEYFFCDIVQSRNKKTSDLVVAEHLIDRYPILWSKYAEEFVNEISKILLIRDESKNVVDSLFTRSLDSFTNPMLYEDVRVQTRQVCPPKAIPSCNVHQSSSLLGVLVREQRREAPAPEALKRIAVSQDGRAEGEANIKRANIHQMPDIGVAMGAERTVSKRVVQSVKKRAGKAKEVRGQMSMKDFIAKTTL